MDTRILCLRVLCLLLLVYPVAVPNILSNMIYNNIKHDKQKQKSSFWIFSIIVFVLTAWLPIYLLESDYKLLSGVSLWHGPVGILVAPVLILLEIGVGAAYALLTKKKIGTISVDDRIGKESPYVWLAVIAVAILEEILFRGVGFMVLSSMGASIWVYVAVSGLLYALNHCHEGVATTVQKLFTGVALALLFIGFKNNILVPIFAHVFENVIVIVWSKRKNEG